MPCYPQYTNGNRPTGTVICTTRGRRRKPVACRFCRRVPADLLCDGPGPDLSRNCDAPICPQCSTQLRVVDADFCPEHGPDAPATDLVGCELGGELQRAIPCGGALVKAFKLCVRHGVLFDHWAGFCGGQEAYRRPLLNREQKRNLFRTWLLGLAPEALDAVLHPRRER